MAAHTSVRAIPSVAPHLPAEATEQLNAVLPGVDVIQEAHQALGHRLAVAGMEMGFAGGDELVLPVVIAAGGDVQPVFFREGQHFAVQLWREPGIKGSSRKLGG